MCRLDNILQKRHTFHETCHDAPVRNRHKLCLDHYAATLLARSGPAGALVHHWVTTAQATQAPTQRRLTRSNAPRSSRSLLKLAWPRTGWSVFPSPLHSSAHICSATTIARLASCCPSFSAAAACTTLQNFSAVGAQPYCLLFVVCRWPGRGAEGRSGRGKKTGSRKWKGVGMKLPCHTTETHTQAGRRASRDVCDSKR